jgi:hypothetical protein
MGATMREDISGLISAMMQTHSGVDLTRMLTQNNIFDAAILRAFLLDLVGDDDDFKEFLEDTQIDNSFIRGFMAGIIQSILIEKGHGEVLGRPSHGELLALYDSASAHLIESSL